MPSTSTRAITRRRIAWRVENSAIAAGPDLATLHAVQRPALISVAIGTAVIAIIGRNTDGSTQIQEPASAVIQPKFSRAAHRCVTLSSIALIGVPAAIADEQQATAEQNTAAKSSVIINEVYAGNTKNAGDPDSKRCDWVELKNTAPQTLT